MKLVFLTLRVRICRVCCRPIYDDVTPRVASSDLAPGQSCVRYLHITEIPDQYSMGVFVFAPHSRIPLHDHPEMCVLSRVLYGDLHRMSLDLARDDGGTLDTCEEKSKRTSWLRGWWKKMQSPLPEGTKRAYKNRIDHLQAPDVTVLYPYEGNLHEFVAGSDGAAVLDILLPPYDGANRRDCTFYEMHELTSIQSSSSGKEPCLVIPTGQPENFHCISGQYRDIGEVEED